MDVLKKDAAGRDKMMRSLCDVNVNVQKHREMATREPLSQRTNDLLIIEVVKVLIDLAYVRHKLIENNTVIDTVHLHLR